jgi:hypothetical protein
MSLINIPIPFSKVIRAVGYDPQSERLTILFTNGKTYRYHRVRASLANGFTRAESAGTYFNNLICNRYLYEVVDNPFGPYSGELGAPKTTKARDFSGVRIEGMTRSESRIATVLAENGSMTAGEIKSKTFNEHDEKRLPEMERKGLVVRLGKVTCGITGKYATLWGLAPKKRRKKAT